MSYKRHSSKVKEQAIKLRVAGKSLNEISARTHVPKPTLSTWLTNIKLTVAQKARLKKKMRLSGLKSGEVKSEQWRKKRKVMVEAANQRYEKVRLSKNALSLIGAALYWAEGNKRESMRFSNADPDMLRLYLRWLTEILHVPVSELVVFVSAHTNVGISNLDIQRYWGKILHISSGEIKVYAAPIPKSSKQTKVGRLPYGTACIKVRKALVWRAHLAALLSKLGKETQFVDQPQSRNATKVVI